MRDPGFLRFALACCFLVWLIHGPSGRVAEAEASGEGSPPSATSHPLLLELAQGLGEGPASRLRMKFDVTFMKIDVADLEARIAPADASRIAPLVRRVENEKAARRAVADVLLASRPILLTMTYLRDSDYGRFRKGIRMGMESARRSGAIDEEMEARLLAGMETDMAPIEARAVSEGDILAYRIDGDSVRTVYLGANGDVVVDVTHEDPILARALPASWFGEESRFRNELIDSLPR